MKKIYMLTVTTTIDQYIYEDELQPDAKVERYIGSFNKCMRMMYSIAERDDLEVLEIGTDEYRLSDEYGDTCIKCKIEKSDIVIIPDVV